MTCGKCGSSDFYRGGRCKSCTYSYVKEWRKKNPEKRLAQTKRWQAKNPAKRYAAKKAWGGRNPEKQRAIDTRANRRRRARLRGASGYSTAEQIESRVQYYGGRCYLCGAVGNEIDHVIPLSRGGSEWPANLRPICSWCNRSKGVKSLASLTQAS